MQNARAQRALPAKKRKRTSQQSQTALARMCPLIAVHFHLRFFCFVSDDCGVNMDSVAGKTGKCLQICAQDLVFKAGWCMKEWEKVMKEQGCIQQRKRSSSSQHGNGNQWHPDCMEGWQRNYRAIKTRITLSIVCVTHRHQVNNCETASALSWLHSGILADPNLDPELPQSPPKHEV